MCKSTACCCARARRRASSRTSLFMAAATDVITRPRSSACDTPFGGVTASAKLDGVKPFPLTGDVGYSGKVNDEAVQVGGHLSGSLENVLAELDASGMKLAGHAQSKPRRSPRCRSSARR